MTKKIEEISYKKIKGLLQEIQICIEQKVKDLESNNKKLKIENESLREQVENWKIKYKRKIYHNE